MPREAAVGLRLIIVYKFGKAVAQATLAVTLLILRYEGVTAHLATLISRLAVHMVHAWTAAAARLLASLLAPNRLILICLALGFDAALSGFEAWALHRRYRWAPWLIVAAAAALIPFELIELARRVRVGRVIILLLNLAIIAYLLRRGRRDMAHPA
jgi:uncharacterized membrane protein (DUF2068 family)